MEIYADGGSIAVTQHGATLLLTMHHPKRRNALSTAMRTALLNEIRGGANNPAIRAIVLTGAQGQFCAGADLNDQPKDYEPDALALRGTIADVLQLYSAIAAGPVPVIAAVEGQAYGMGMSLAMACDHIIAAESARFGAIFSRLGLLPDCGLLHSLVQRSGVIRARKILTLGSIVEAQDALSFGMADEIVGDGQAVDKALDYAKHYSEASPASIAYIRGALARGVAGIDAVTTTELDLVPLLALGGDAREALTAFREKRRPYFAAINTTNAAEGAAL